MIGLLSIVLVLGDRSDSFFILSDAALVTCSPAGRQPVGKFIGWETLDKGQAKLVSSVTHCLESGYVEGLSVASIS